MQVKIEPLLINAFHNTVKQNDFPLIQSYLIKYPHLLYIPDKEGLTPLEYAVKKGEIDLTKLLLQYGDPLAKLSHIDLAYKARNHATLRKYLRHELETRYKNLSNSQNTLEETQEKMVLASNLSLYFHYGMADFTGTDSFSKNSLDYITEAERLFEKIVQENEFSTAELIDLHLSMGKVCLLLQNPAGVIKYYSFVVNEQNTLLQDKGYQENLVESLGNNLISLMKAYLKFGSSFEPSSSSTSLSNKYAHKNYLKVLEIADSTPTCLPEKQKFLICYQAGLACRYIGECYEQEGRFTESLAYCLKSIEAFSNIINGLGSDIANKHAAIVQELAHAYRRLSRLYQSGKISLTAIQEGLKTLALVESKNIISDKKSAFQDENLIPQFYQAQKIIDELLEKNLEQSPDQFWKKSDSKNKTKVISDLTEMGKTVSNSPTIIL